MPERLPEVSHSLLKHLEEMFPNVLPEDPLVDCRVVASHIGQQKVIEHLRSLYRFQQNESNPLEGALE